LEFREELALKNEEDVPSIAPVIRHITGAVFHMSYTHIAHRYRAPAGATGFSRVFGRWDALPVHNLEW
jgi:hypothetical protein